MKKLIYFTLGNNPSYIELLKLCILSLKKHKYDGDFLFITDLKDLILKNISFDNKVHFMNVRTTDLFSSSSNKLKLYDFDKVNEYDKIVYSDLDILFTGNPNVIFDEITEDKFYVSNENALMSEEWWGLRILNQDEKNKIFESKVLGINAGFFAFNKNMVQHLHNIDTFLQKNIRLANQCIEQPFFNVYLYRNSLYDNILTKYISHNGYNEDKFNGIVLHFAGGPGNFSHKQKKMINYLNKNTE